MSLRPGISLRLSELRNLDGKSVILQVDQGMMLGPMKGIVDLEDTVKSLKNEVDAVVVSRGQVGRLVEYFRGRGAPALLIRMDWANVCRDETFVLPARTIKHVMLASAKEALALGASATVAFLFVGYENDEDEARNIGEVAALARNSECLGVPLLVEAMPIGGRIIDTNYADCVDLAARISVEVGANAVAVPYTGNVNSFRRIVDAAKSPVFTLDEGNTKKTPVEIVKEALQAGATGVVVGRRVLQSAEPLKALKALKSVVHKELRKRA